MGQSSREENVVEVVSATSSDSVVVVIATR